MCLAKTVHLALRVNIKMKMTMSTQVVSFVTVVKWTLFVRSATYVGRDSIFIFQAVRLAPRRIMNIKTGLARQVAIFAVALSIARERSAPKAPAALLVIHARQGSM